MKAPPPLPAFAAEADYQIVGALSDVLALNRDTVRRLFRHCDGAYLRALVRSEPEAAFELLCGEDVTSLWCAGHRLAVISTKGKRS